MKLTLVILVLYVFTFVVLSQFVTTKNQKDLNKMDWSIELIIGNETFEATLKDNPTSLSLIEQMPFQLELSDYHGVEKIFHPDKELSKEEAPQGYEPKSGEITCYGPWGNVAIFYKDFDYSRGLIPMGHVEQIDAFVQALENNNQVRFQLKK